MNRKRRARRGRSRHAAQQTRPWARALWFGLGALAIIGLAALLALAPLRTSRSAATPAAGQQVLVTMAGFTPDRLTARAGQGLTLTFVNSDSRFHTDGGGWHQFRIEALDLDVQIPPSSQKTVTLSSLRAGTYEFYCDVCCGGKENPTMRGILEVLG